MKKSLAHIIVLLLGFWVAAAFAQNNAPELSPVADGPFKPDWESLRQYQCPDWFRDAKFGIWAHWGPQCEPEQGDWYARNMYMEGSEHYKYHVQNYGPQSKVGFKDIIHRWKAENFDPDKLVGFYKENGAKYFMALANHHDNFDLFDSKHQPWNSVALGPKKDLIGGWAKAAKKHGLRFGVSVHASRPWSWLEPSQGADKKGPNAGIPYDGKLTKADGKGQWWDGLDPQDLYAQNHKPGKTMHWEWNAAKGSSTPSAAYMEKFYRRTKQLWDDYQPDQMYFDDHVLPMHGVTDEIGLKLAAHFYNSSIKLHGKNEAVMNGKKLDPMQRKAIVYDIERGKAHGILPEPWQTDTCIGQWHYQRSVFEKHEYKSAASVIRMLADIVSKNGNLMLNVPLQRGGQPDADEIRIVSEIGSWLKVNGEAIYATRPWTIYGEGPSTTEAEKGRFDGQKDVQSKPFTAEDIRFTRSKDGTVLYAIVLEIPNDGRITVKSLALNSENWPGEIGSVELVGGGKLKTTRNETGLHVMLPEKFTGKTALALKITRPSGADAERIGKALPSPVPAKLTVTLADKPGKTLAPRFLGLSFETYLMLPVDGKYYLNADDQALVQTFKTLGIKSLRVGGNAVDDAELPVPQEKDIDALFAFAKAAGVKVIYSVRLNHGDPAQSARLASYIRMRYADWLDGFAIGNEPEEFTKKSFETYYLSWKPHYDAVLKAVPDAKFVGPSSNSADFCAKLGQALFQQGHISTITHHWYPMGRGTEAEKDIEKARARFLSNQSLETYQARYKKVVEPLESAHIPFRYDELNSCWNGGAKGASDTYTSTLWALDWLHWWAARNIEGMNFHTSDEFGTTRIYTTTAYKTFARCGTGLTGYDMSPIAYAFLAFTQGAHGQPLATTVSSSQKMDFTAYAFRNAAGGLSITLINKTHGAKAQQANVILQIPPSSRQGKWERLDLVQKDHDISAKTGVTLGGAAIDTLGKWGGNWQPLKADGDKPLTIHVAPCSAAIVRYQPVTQ